MAVWQFELQAFPANLAEIGGVPAIHLTPKMREQASLAFSLEQRRGLVRALDDLLPRHQAWSTGVMVWGNTRATDVQLYVDDDGSAELHVRIDARSFGTELVEALCDIVRDLDLAFVTEDGAVLMPRSETVLRALASSKAHRFSEDPEGIFDEAARQIYRPA